MLQVLLVRRETQIQLAGMCVDAESSRRTHTAHSPKHGSSEHESSMLLTRHVQLQVTTPAVQGPDWPRRRT